MTRKRIRFPFRIRQVIAMLRKGVTSAIVMLTLAIMVGIMGMVAVTLHLNPTTSPKGRGFELATKTALYVDALSSVDAGQAVLDMGIYKYDVEMCYSSYWTIIKENIVSKFRDAYMKDFGYYVSVVPYDDQGKRLDDDATAYMVRSYSRERGCKKALKGVSKLCIKKEAGKALAEVVGC